LIPEPLRARGFAALRSAGVILIDSGGDEDVHEGGPSGLLPIIAPSIEGVAALLQEKQKDDDE
jgi:hypothetical protein